jgi:hypothetical protein
MRNLFVNKERADINTLSGTEFQVSEKLFFKHQRPHVIICSGNIWFLSRIHPVNILDKQIFHYINRTKKSRVCE